MHRRKFLTTVGTTATVGIAGCTGDSSTDESNGENSDGEDGSDEPSLEDFSFPEHATRDELEESEFVSAHFDYIENEGSVTVRQTEENVFRGNSFETETQSRISSDGIIFIEEDEETTTKEWTEIGNSRGLIRRDIGFQTVYQITDNSQNQRAVLSKRNLDLVTGMFDFGEATSATDIDGTLVARYEADSIAETQLDGYKPFGADEFTNGTASIFITERGVVKRATYEIEYQSRGNDEARNVEVTFANIGTTDVSEPEWAETARNEGRAFEATVTDDGFLSFTLESGDPVAAGTHLLLSPLSGSQHLSVPTEISVGDRLVVATTNGDVSLGVNEKPTTSSDFTGRFVYFEIRSEAGVTLYEEDINFDRDR
ncbi:hypothetical protein [Natrinema sp. HArc-T2]|uniref:DUF7537 family lipoprotein n=1 Tax=Natrinema sp. HArc-T2 TaxID=3242701 RepID=UPI00359CFA71